MSKEKSFTLIELLVIISIIGLLVSMVSVSFKISAEKARDAKREVELNQLAKALEIYWSSSERYPQETKFYDTSMGCGDTLPNGDEWCEESDLEVLTPGFISKLPVDPLKNSDFYYYFEPYESDPDEGFDVGACGTENCSWKLCANKLERTGASYCVYSLNEGITIPAPPPPLTWLAGFNHRKQITINNSTQIVETLDLQVGAGADDTLVYWDGSAWVAAINDANIRVGYFSSYIFKMGNGLKFTNVAIPAGATITAAYLMFTSSGTMSSNTVNTVIIGEKSNNANAFSTLADYQTRRGTVVGGPNNDNITAASVNWDGLPAWTSGTKYQSPEIKTIIQEIINLPGWASGNALALFWDDHANRSTNNPSVTTERRAYSYNGSTANAPTLHVEYTLPQTNYQMKVTLNKGSGTDSISGFQLADSGSGTNWSNIPNAYDDNTGTYAIQGIPYTEPNGWKDFLVLTYDTPVRANKLRYYIAKGYGYDTPAIDIDVYYDSAWHDAYQGAPGTYNQYQEKGFAGAYVSQVRIRFQYGESGIYGNEFYVYELQLYSAPAVYLNNHCQDDFDDVRFTKLDGISPLDYWIESSSSASANVWVEFPISSSPGPTNFYIYYDNASASSESNGNNTFIFFDDFTGTTINTDKWTVVDTGSNISQNGVLTIANGTAVWGQTGMYSKSNFSRSNNILIQGKYKSTAVRGATYKDTTMIWTKDITADLNYPAMIYGLYPYESGGSHILHMYEDGTGRQQVGTWLVNTQYWFRQIFKSAGGATTQWSTDGNSWSTLYNSSYSTETPVKVGFTHYQGGDVIIDDVIVHKYASAEPTFGIWGSEEQE